MSSQASGLTPDVTPVACDGCTRALKATGPACRCNRMANSHGLRAADGAARRDRKGAPVLVIDERSWVADAVVALLGGYGFAAEGADRADLPDSVVGEGVALVGAVGEETSRVVRLLADRGWRTVAFGCRDDTTAAHALESGAAAALSDQTETGDFVTAVRQVAAGLPVVEPAERERLLAHLRAVRSRSEPAAFQRLTGREREVLGALVDGRRSGEIASSDFVSVTTVRNQIQSILTKLNVGSQLEAVALARRVGWPDGAMGGSASSASVSARHRR